MIWSVFGVALAGSDSVGNFLREAYGPEVAFRSRGYLDGEDLSPEESAAVLEAVRLIAEAGYSGEYSLEYLRLAGDLSGEGITLGDLTNKIREGIAKGVDGSRLVHVLEKRSAALKEGRVLVLQLEKEGVNFLDRQMACRVFADYLLRGVKGGDLAASVRGGDLREFPALDRMMR